MKFSIIATLAAFAVAQPASAAIIEITSTGTLSSGFDGSGRFGAANTDLTGMAYSVVEYFDSSAGLYTDRGAPGDNIVGGTGSVTGAPGFAWASLTINGVSVTIYGDAFSYVIAGFGGSSVGSLLYQVRDAGIETTAQLEVRLHPTLALPLRSVFDSYHGDCLGSDICNGGFLFAKTSADPPIVVYYDDHGIFAGDSYDIRVLGAVPEPATWAMMILGFGLVGSALRRRAKLEYSL